jgi:hypothetical protein
MKPVSDHPAQRDSSVGHRQCPLAFHRRSPRVFPTLQDYIAKAEQRTAHNTGLTLVIAANYGGRWDMPRRHGGWPRRLQRADCNRLMSPGDFASLHLPGRSAGAGFVHPHRWRAAHQQFSALAMAYTELYFTDRLWPDFDADDLDAACAAFASRQRRFGQTSEQVAHGSGQTCLNSVSSPRVFWHPGGLGGVEIAGRRLWRWRCWRSFCWAPGNGRGWRACKIRDRMLYVGGVLA